MGKNHLNKEKSPYLLQHKDNPVWWHPWDEEAFKRAKAENKPIFLSIGYSTCHWCHVMEKESFEDPTVAEVLNQHFVSIKVDREERPDVDAIYMSSVLAISGHGGWPMSVWLTPDGRPFFGATYFPRDRFISLLNRIAEVWQSDQSAVEKDAEKLLQAISITHSPSKSEEPQWMSTILDRFVERLRSSFDSTRGGFGSAPKFPQSLSLMALMRLNVSRKNKSIDEVVRKTLDGMCRGGMYDHLVGGFHRYSVDEKWLVPHFEKMLYDNALLAQTYTEAYQYFGDEEYALVAKEILDYILAEMTSPSGGFYSAQDADSLSPETNEKEEGYFATYDYETLQSILTTEELNEVCRVYGACREGHFEGRNILHLQPSFQRKNISDRPVLSSALTKLRQLRRSRFSPHLDDKVVSAWNGWTITAMVKAASCFSSPSATASPSHYLQAAIRAGEFIWQELFRNNTLHRRWRDGEARFTAYSDDYAAVINGYLHLFQATGDEKWYTRSLTLQTILDAQYWDRKSGGYFRDSGQDKTLIVRLKEDHDGVRPNANSLAATNLLWLYALTLDNNYLEKAQAIFDYYQPILTDYPTNLPQMVTALDLYLHKPQQVVIVEAKEGEGEDFLKAFNQKFSPNAFIVKIAADNPSIPLTQDKTLRGNKTTYYVCQGSHCQAPTNDAMEALNQINIV